MRIDDVKPTLDRVLARRIHNHQASAAGIILPAGQSQQAEVLAVGPGKCFPGGLEDPVPLKVGDRIIIGRGGWPVYADGEELVCIRFLDIWAVVDAA